MFDVMADWMAVPLINSEAGNPPKRMALAHPSIAPYGVFNSRDGKGILISIQSEREWKKLCAEVLDQPDLPNDPRFANMVERVRNRQLTDKTVADSFAAMNRVDLLKRLDAADIAFAEVNTMADLCRAPASAPHRGRYAERQGELRRARRDLRRSAAALWRRARDRRPCRTCPKLPAPRAASHDRSPSTSTICANGSATPPKRPMSSPRSS